MGVGICGLAFLRIAGRLGSSLQLKTGVDPLVTPGCADAFARLADKEMGGCHAESGGGGIMLVIEGTGPPGLWDDAVTLPTASRETMPRGAATGGATCKPLAPELTGRLSRSTIPEVPVVTCLPRGPRGRVTARMAAVTAAEGRRLASIFALSVVFGTRLTRACIGVVICRKTPSLLTA